MRARIIVDCDYEIGEAGARLYGSFVEHLGRCVYSGIYEPGHPTADRNGFRRDVLELVRELGVSVVRYPGGNFVSGFKWEDSVGPKDKRPARRNLAWMSLESNEFGLDEFIEWCRLASVEPMMAVNLGTRGPSEAGELFEYCNHPAGTYWSDLRRSHGHENPHDIRLWCLGNEMDGSWQMGAKTAREYGRDVREAAKMMSWPDKNRSSTVFPKSEFVACGSSGASMPSFGQWEADVLEEAFDHIDLISLHSYFGNSSGDILDFLACSEKMDAFIKDVSSVCDYVAVKKKSRKRIMLSFDEWNVWYHSMKDECSHPAWSLDPPLLEDVYRMSDALAVGGMLISLINNADRVKIACQAQLVNVIAPIMTQRGGSAWRQTIFHPFALASKYGRGAVLRSLVECPGYDCAGRSSVPFLASAVVREKSSSDLGIFLLNRNLNESLELELDLRGFADYCSCERHLLFNSDLDAANTQDYPDRVKPVQDGKIERKGKLFYTELPPASWTLLRLAGK